MILLTSTIALALSFYSGQAAREDHNPIKFELRSAERDPGKELIEALVPKSDQRIFLHKEVLIAVADEEGRFKFGSIPSGRFRLVVRDPLNLFCLGNMPLEVVNWPRGKARPLVIHIRPAGIDDCSYGDFK